MLYIARIVLPIRYMTDFASGPPWDQKIAKENLVLIDHPKVVK